jgi:hypothetical protein
MGKATTTEQEYKEGTLVVDIYDAKTQQLIWRGSAEDALSDKEAKNEKNLDKVWRRCSRGFLRALPRVRSVRHADSRSIGTSIGTSVGS